jgi:hypothetical protein
MLEVQRDRAWHDIVTLDESCFYLSTNYEFVWLPRDEQVPGNRYCFLMYLSSLISLMFRPDYNTRQ